MERSIIHLNVADFAVAVERLLDRRLTGRPLIIAPEAAPRATVYDMSDEAYQAGVRKGMPLHRAARLCRDAPILPPRPQRYEQAMTDLLHQGLPYSPLIEPGECDGHLFVDVSRMWRGACAAKSAPGSVWTPSGRWLPTNWWPRWPRGWSNLWANTLWPRAMKRPYWRHCR
jgi:hypothetical protein